MSDIIRAFLAVQLAAPPPLVAVLEKLRQLGRAVKVVAAENLHITLKFLGDIDAGTIPAIRQAMCEAVWDQTGFTVRIRGLSAFPHPGLPSVIWAGLLDAEPLSQMAHELEEKLQPLGFRPEARPFQVHLTLARIKAAPTVELRSILQHHTATDFGMAAVRSVELIQSDLRPAGPRYTMLHSEPLPQL